MLFSIVDVFTGEFVQLFSTRKFTCNFVDGTEILAYRARDLLERRENAVDDAVILKIEQELAWGDDMLEVLVDSYRALKIL